jgi:DNA repair photolyase
MSINIIQVKSILQKSGIPGVAYVINPYTGCVHGCVYCYARFMKRFTGHTEKWGTFLDVKENAPELLQKQLQRQGMLFKDEVFLSSVTDPYLPAETKFQLTRKILEILLEYQVPISILTKSDLVLRDLDLFKQFERCSVGLSLMTCDDEIARIFEPYATPPTRRLQAFQTLKEHGIATYAFVSPYLPRLSAIEQIMQALAGLVNEVGVEAINTRGANWYGVAETLAHHYPHLLSGYKELARDESYWQTIEGHARHLAAQLQIPFMGFYRH